MYCWRITKYNPINRNDRGEYIKDEWTSYFDIDKIFQNKKFALDEYEYIEDKYIQVVLSFMDCLNVTELQITNLELMTSDGKKIAFQNNIVDEQLINKKFIPNIIRFVLRDLIWCKLESPKMYVHFGHDYYMYIGTIKPCKKTIEKIKEIGLFVENYISPYYSNTKK